MSVALGALTGPSPESMARKVFSWTFMPFLVSLGFAIAYYGYGRMPMRIQAIYWGTLAITFAAEYVFPFNPDWNYRFKKGTKTERRELLHDVLTFAILPQLPWLIWVEWSADAARRWFSSHHYQGIWPQHWPHAAQLVLLVIVTSLVSWFHHRLLHRWSLLWRFHRVHHASDKLSVLKALVVHPLAEPAVFIVPVATLLGAPVIDMLAWIVVKMMIAHLSHANLRLRYGVLSWIFVTPEMHRVHHSYAMEDSRSNYGTELIIWDRLFGSYRAQSVDGNHMRIGVAGLMPRNALSRALWPFYKNVREDLDTAAAPEQGSLSSAQ